MMYKTIPWNLIISHLKQETDQKEEAALNDWKNSEGNGALYKELKSLWKEIQAEVGEYDPDVSYYWEQMEARMGAKRNVYTVPVWKYKFAMVAASLLLIVSVSVAFLAGRISGRPEVASQSYSALNGKSQMILPDGSVVWLNIGSTLAYKTSFTGNREVWLEGEALFQVKKDREHPFTVCADNIKVNVHGTRFNVKAYPGNPDIRVALLEGRISLLVGDKETFMKAGELAQVDRKTNLLRMPSADVYFESCWANKSCSFEARPLDYICKYLERWYNISIELDPAIANTSYTFTITDEPLETILQIMSRINPIRYSFEENKRVIISEVKPLKKIKPMK